MSSSSSHQDWEPFIIRGKGLDIEKKKKRDGNTETHKRFDTAKASSMRKLEAADGVVKPRLINPKICAEILRTRTLKKLSCKDVANKISISTVIFTQYEKGSITADVNILRKLERLLSTKLTGKDYGGINV